MKQKNDTGEVASAGPRTQIIGSLLQTDNHAKTLSVNYLQA